MPDRSLGRGFRFSRVMAWAPALILAMGFLLILRGYLAAGLLLAVAALVYWFIVRRRKSQAAP